MLRRVMKPLLPLLCFATLFFAGCGDREARTGLKNRGVESTDAALFTKAQEGDADAVKLLVRSGRPPDAVEKWSGRTPLMFAAEGGHLAVVEALIAAKADVKARIVCRKPFVAACRCPAGSPARHAPRPVGLR